MCFDAENYMKASVSLREPIGGEGEKEWALWATRSVHCFYKRNPDLPRAGLLLHDP